MRLSRCPRAFRSRRMTFPHTLAEAHQEVNLGSLSAPTATHGSCNNSRRWPRLGDVTLTPLSFDEHRFDPRPVSGVDQYTPA